jgi:hypothetical protein
MSRLVGDGPVGGTSLGAIGGEFGIPLAHRCHRRDRRRPLPEDDAMAPHRSRGGRDGPQPRSPEQPGDRRATRPSWIYDRCRSAFRCREVANLRIYHNIPSAASLHDATLPAAEVAKRLGVCPHTIINWINKGWFVGHRGLENRWHVPVGSEVEATCRERIARSAQISRPDDSEQQKADEYTVRQIAAELRVSVDVVYYWIKHQHLEARRGHDGGPNG